jgi:hypothetical protein
MSISRAKGLSKENYFTDWSTVYERLKNDPRLWSTLFKSHFIGDNKMV